MLVTVERTKNFFEMWKNECLNEKSCKIQELRGNESIHCSMLYKIWIEKEFPTILGNAWRFFKLHNAFYLFWDCCVCCVNLKFAQQTSRSTNPLTVVEQAMYANQTIARRPFENRLQCWDCNHFNTHAVSILKLSILLFSIHYICSNSQCAQRCTKV